jgi:hypothetical protein
VVGPSSSKPETTVDRRRASHAVADGHGLGRAEARRWRLLLGAIFALAGVLGVRYMLGGAARGVVSKLGPGSDGAQQGGPPGPVAGPPSPVASPPGPSRPPSPS